MKIAGIIAEYNPFHSGHKYHIEETKRVTGADQVIVVMSGDFVQRGEPAIVDKYLRTRMALEGGADLVIEMPALYATASAEYFATAGVGILHALGCVDYLSFGSEWAGVEELSQIADILLEEPPIYKETLKKLLEQGKNYPQARVEAVVATSGKETHREILDTPNHILGIEYIKALHRKKSKIQPVVIHREGSQYHEGAWDASQAEQGEYPSATALRKILYQAEKAAEKIDIERDKSWLKDKNSLLAGVPYCGEELWHRMNTDDMVTWDELMPYLDYMILMKHKVLGKYFGMDYDLSRRISKRFLPGKTFQETMENCHSRNYTDAALRRIFLHLVLQLKDYPFLHEAASIPLPYARVLGFRREAGRILSMIREEGSIALIQKPVEGKELGKKNQIAATIYDKDIRSADLYEQLSAARARREMKKEWVRNPVML